MTTTISDLVSPARAFADYVRQRHAYDVQLMGLAQIDQTLVRQIIESGFNERLARHYFDGKENAKFFMVGEKGVAVLLDDYLDILVAADGHQHNGIGPALLGRVIDETDGRSYWRSQPFRPANDSYRRITGPNAPIPIVSVDGIAYNTYFVGYNESEIPPRLGHMTRKISNFEPKKSL